MHLHSPAAPARLTLKSAGEGVVALALVTAIGAVALIWPEPDTRLAASCRDLARFLIIAVLAFSGPRFVVAAGVSRTWASAATVFAAMSLGIGVELFEVSVGGGFSGRDVAMDLAACLAGLAAGQRRALWMGVALLLLLAAAMPFAHVLRSYSDRRNNFPVLLDAQRSADLDWVRAMPGSVHIGLVDDAMRSEPGERAFVVPLDAGPMPGLAIDEPYGDWSAYATLAIELVNAGDAPLDLVLNVDDMRGSGKAGDRYDERVLLAPRTRKVLRTSLASMVRSIPHRRFALEDMDIVMLYRNGSAAGEQVLIRKIWLE